MQADARAPQHDHVLLWHEHLGAVSRVDTGGELAALQQSTTRSGIVYFATENGVFRVDMDA